MNILFAAAGSIGHIAPCIAVWRAVEKLSPDARAHFVCSTIPEDRDFLEEEHVTFTALSGRRVPLLSFPIAFFRAWSLLGRVKPDVIFTKGGGVTVPVAVAGWVRRIPIVVHESDSVPGRATRFISRFAATSINGFTAGNIVRPDVMQGSREQGLRMTSLTGNRPILLVSGGSQGAQSLNDAVVVHLDELLQHVDVVHITGRGKNAAAAKQGYWSCPFAHQELPHLYAIAALALSRAGAGSISELAANGIPAILVPLEGVAHDHQVKNAEAAALSGGCILLRQAVLEGDMVRIVRDLATRSGIRDAMCAKIRTLYKPDADVAVAKILLASGTESCRVP